jgi:cobalt/nickel transport system permease protein
MGAGHGHKLHYHGHSRVHRLPAHVKLVTLLAFVIVVVATPREHYGAFAAYLVLIGAVIIATRIPLSYIARRLVLEIPFLLFAILVPFIATGPRVAVGPLHVSQPGLLSAWGLLAKGTLGVLASLTLAATTEPQELLRGLERLRLPQQLVQIAGFMVRYLDVVTGELERMRIARESRGFTGSSVRAWPALAATAGALFIRSYERGERVHLAMLSRGYQGRMPASRAGGAPPRAWVQAGILPVLAALVLAVAMTR